MSREETIKRYLKDTSLTYEIIGNLTNCTKQYVSKIAKRYGLQRRSKPSKPSKPKKIKQLEFPKAAIELLIQQVKSRYKNKSAPGIFLAIDIVERYLYDK